MRSEFGAVLESLGYLVSACTFAQAWISIRSLVNSSSRSTRPPRQRKKRAQANEVINILERLNNNAE